MKRLKPRLLSRSAVLVQILLILGAVFFGYLFPQRLTTSQQELDQWNRSHPFWGSWVERLGLDHIYTTPWFAALLFVFLVTLVLSAMAQFKRAYGLTFGPGSRSRNRSVLIPVSGKTLTATLRAGGYYRVHGDDAILRFVKNPWGHWGGLLLHLGIVVVIGASLLIVVTETRGLLHLLEGEILFPGDSWVVEETGMLAKSFILPEAVRLEQVIPEYWETDDVKQLTTIFSFIDTKGRMTRHTLGINRTVNDKGLRVYQGRRYGDAFYVTLRDRSGGEFNTIFQMEHPFRRDRASYGNFRIDGVPYPLKAKYFANAEKKSIETRDPLLVIRLMKQEKVVDEVSLRTGEEAPFGPYAARLVRVAPWSGIIFVRNKGMSGIFLGFVIIIVGAGLTYFTPPREILAGREEGGFRLAWKASRFGKFYEEEYNGLLSALGGNKG